MRIGCSGCLMVLIVSAALGIGLPWLASGILGEPELQPAATPRGALAAAERKIEVLAAEPKGRGRPDTIITLSEGEVAALLASRLPDLAGTPIGRIRVRLRDQGRVELAARTSIRTPLGELAGWERVNLLPAGWLEQPLWLHLDVRPRLEPGTDDDRRYLRFDVERFHVGRRRLPALLLRLFLDPTTLGLLRWPVPAAVDEVQVEPGRIRITVTSSR